MNRFVFNRLVFASNYRLRVAISSYRTLGGDKTEIRDALNQRRRMRETGLTPTEREYYNHLYLRTEIYGA